MQSPQTSGINIELLELSNLAASLAVCPTSSTLFHINAGTFLSKLEQTDKLQKTTI